jgi:poly-beta-1,6-N-acetyl-D-glucosamine biosynthesis protein PgaD
MQDSPIINARRQLRWQRRLFSDATTALLWAGWLWLCRPAVFAVTRLLAIGLGLSLKHPAAKLLSLGAPVSVEGTALALAGTSALLILWNRLSSQPALRPRLTRLPDYAGHFGIDTQAIVAGRHSAICTVHHDEQGRITRIDVRSAKQRSALEPAAAGTLAADYRQAA